MRAELKEGHNIPMAIDRRCVDCRVQTLCVNVAGPLSYTCQNRSCQSGLPQYLPCMLKVRDYQTVRMDLHLRENLVLTTDETGQIVPDFDSPEMADPELVEAPFKNCPGVLVWDDGTDPNSEYCWLRCNVCAGLYRSIIFVSFGLIGIQQRHKQYVLQSRMGPPELIFSHRSHGPASPVPRTWLAVIDRVRFDGEDLDVRRS
jgi:hypothetical protein